MTTATVELTGKHWIAGKAAAEGPAVFAAANPATGEKLEPRYPEATASEIDRALKAAQEVFNAYRAMGADKHAELLDAIADAIEALGEPLLERAHAETGLPMPRLTGERGRTTGQTRLFAKMVREGSWVRARIDHAEPDRAPLPKPDVRQMLAPIGPVVCFGASNFPLAIGVVGTDTISALAAGCPVVVKSHPAHPGTCEMLAQAVYAACEKTGVPKAVFSLVHGAGHESGLALVRHPLTQAVAFTGSLKGGRALFDAAAARPNPIPVYAEMGSSNPVFLLPGALKERAAAIAAGYVGSVTLGVGQFCTNPGVVLGIEGDDLKTFREAAGKAASDIAPATMLHAGICSAFDAGASKIAATKGVDVVGRSAQQADAAKAQAACQIYTADIATFESNNHLAEEVFGPTSVVVRCGSKKDLLRVAANLEGHLTATIHGTEKDLAEHADLVALLENKVGRLVFNGFPTGIEVCHAMHHGGPYPSTTDGHFTSIGTGSIDRFVRPVCYQNFPDAALPEALKARNARSIWRLIDGVNTQADA